MKYLKFNQQILNTLNVDMDLISGLISTNANELYKPINIIDDTEKDKARSFYLLIKVSVLNYSMKYSHINKSFVNILADH